MSFPWFYPIVQSQKGHPFISAYMQISKLFFLYVVAILLKHYFFFNPTLY